MDLASKLDCLRPLILSRLPDGNSKDHIERARQFFQENKLVTNYFGTIDLRERPLWSATDKRSIGRYEHAFMYIHDWPTFIHESPDASSLAMQALIQTKDWEDKFPTPEASLETMAYHDETTAQRLKSHLNLLTVVDTVVDSREVDWLHGFLDRTADLLMQDDFYAGLNNHGMFQDSALIDYVGLASWRSEHERSRMLEVALDRVHRYFSMCFTAEGVHVENTPTYHVMVSRAVVQHIEVLQALRHPEASRFEHLLRSLSQYATHAVMPNGLFPPISDTHRTSLESATKVYDSGEFTYAISQGERGVRPPMRTLLLPESGYAIYRSAWGDPNATYLLFHSAYNSDYHKHADENSFILFSEGEELITEAGPYGYDYKDPLTKYGYSQFAHNTIILDGKSIRRTGGDKSHVSLNIKHTDDSGFTAVGRNERLVDAVHERTLSVTEVGGQPQISITDEVASPTEREIAVLWNLGPNVRPITHERGFELFKDDKRVLVVDFHSDAALRVDLLRGQKKPAYLGWRFPRFGSAQEANVIRVQLRAREAVLRTSLRLERVSALLKPPTSTARSWPGLLWSWISRAVTAGARAARGAT